MQPAWRRCNKNLSGLRESKALGTFRPQESIYGRNVQVPGPTGRVLAKEPTAQSPRTGPSGPSPTTAQQTSPSLKKERVCKTPCRNFTRLDRPVDVKGASWALETPGQAWPAWIPGCGRKTPAEFAKIHKKTGTKLDTRGLEGGLGGTLLGAPLSLGQEQPAENQSARESTGSSVSALHEPARQSFCPPQQVALL